MRHELGPIAHLLETVAASQFSRGTGAQIHVVIVIVTAPPVLVIFARALLLVDVRHVELAERAVVKPVVTSPPVHHGIHRHGHFERRVRIDQRHQRQKTVVGNSQNADLAIRFRNIFNEPVNGVVRVSGMINGRGIQRPMKRAGHDVVAFGAVFSANILNHPDVSAFENHFERVVVAAQVRAEVRAVEMASEAVGVVRSARQKDRGVFGTCRNEDDGMQLRAVAHRDHHDAPCVVKSVGDHIQLSGSFARQRGFSG